jgi:NadR type nicotinamide-nucleotide adenylyltransferase
MPDPLKIAITGPESTGKSILAERLAEHYNSLWVPEFSRSFLENLGRPYVAKDILTIARGQLSHELQLQEKAYEYLFCDTDLIVTKIWSEYKYGTCDPWIIRNIAENRYYLYLLCDIDLPWIEDPLREHPHHRRELFNLFLRELATRRFPFRIISGIGESRLENAIRCIDEYRESKVIR